MFKIFCDGCGTSEEEWNLTEIIQHIRRPNTFKLYCRECKKKIQTLEEWREKREQQLFSQLDDEYEQQLKEMFFKETS